jgi:YggT family protein
MYALKILIEQLFNIYWWVLLLTVVSSWLIAFGIVNVHNPNARQVLRVLHTLTDPVLSPIRRVIPAIGGIDFSPLIALVGLQFLQNWLLYTVLPLMTAQ